MGEESGWERRVDGRGEWMGGLKRDFNSTIVQ